MPFSFRRLSQAGWLSLGVLGVLSLTVWALSSGWNRSPSLPVPAQTSKERIPTIGVTLTRFGFQPAAIKVAEGKSLLVVRNISGAEKFQLELAEVRGQKLVVEKPKEEKRFWEKPLNLKAGEYVLSVTENPRWSLALTVIAAEKK